MTSSSTISRLPLRKELNRGNSSKRTRQAGHDVARERQPLAGALTVLGDEVAAR